MEDQSTIGAEDISGDLAGAKVVASLGDLPACTAETEGWLYYIQSESKFQYCTGGVYQDIDITGPQGESAVPGIVVKDSTDTVLGYFLTEANGYDYIDILSSSNYIYN